MSDYTYFLTLSPASLKRVLDAIRAARPIPRNPVQASLLFQSYRSTRGLAAGSAAADLALIELLNAEIIQSLHTQRRHYLLSPPSTDQVLAQALEALALDFRQQCPELEAWSLLFFRYVRVDLCLSWEQIATTTAQTRRTLRRRQLRGLLRLTYQILERNRRARGELSIFPEIVLL